MREADAARHAIAARRSHMNDIAEELARRTTFKYQKKRAKQAAIEKASQAVELAHEHPEWMGIMAAAGGIAVTTVLAVGRKSKFLALLAGIGAAYAMRGLVKKTLP